MFADLSPSREMGSPYQGHSKIFSELLNQVQRSFSNSFSQLEENIYKWWCSPYYFCPKQKANVAILKENKTKAFQTATGDQNLCVIEPCLSQSVPSQISFKVNSFSGNYFSVGICLNNIVKALQYTCQGTIRNYCSGFDQSGVLHAHV
mgnify:CR=1 FL=1